VTLPLVERGGITSDPRRVALAITLPIGVLALAYILWWISDRVVYVGPLDKAAFDWVVVAPIWLLAPLAAGWTWRDLAPRASALARPIVGVVVTTVAAGLFWVAAAEPGCEFGPRTAPIGWVIPSLLIGALLGSGLVVGGSHLAREIKCGRRGSAVILGISAQAGAAILAVGVFYFATLFLAGCERPSGL
jgi:hypothetical protein